MLEERGAVTVRCPLVAIQDAPSRADRSLARALQFGGCDI